MLYIQVDVTLIDHPKTKKLARLLGVSRMTAVGHLVTLWSWAAQYAPDGDLTAYREEPEAIADGAQWEGDAALFVNALINARVGERSGFLEDGIDGSLWLHDWGEYFGKVIDRRKADAERKRNEREAERARTSQSAPDAVRRTSDGHPQDTQRKSSVNVAQRSVAQRNVTEPSETHADGAGAPAPVAPPPTKPLPKVIEVYTANGGTFPPGKLADGTSKAERAMAWIAERVTDDAASLKLWAAVVAGYCAQWSPKSYTVMVNDYYARGRIPGEPQKEQGSNGRTAANRGFGLQSLKAAERYPAWNPDAAELERARAEWEAAPTGADLDRAAAGG